MRLLIILTFFEEEEEMVVYFAGKRSAGNVLDHFSLLKLFETERLCTTESWFQYQDVVSLLRLQVCSLYSWGLLLSGMLSGLFVLCSLPVS